MNKNDKQIIQAKKIREKLFALTKNLIQKWQFYFDITDSNYSKSNQTQKQKHSQQHKHQSSKYSKSFKNSVTQQYEQDKLKKSNFLKISQSKQLIQDQRQSQKFNLTPYGNNYASMTDIKQKGFKNVSKYTNSTKQFESACLIVTKGQIQQKRSEQSTKDKRKGKEIKYNEMNEYIYAKQQAQYLRNKYLEHLALFHNKKQVQTQQKKLKQFLKNIQNKQKP